MAGEDLISSIRRTAVSANELRRTEAQLREQLRAEQREQLQAEQRLVQERQAAVDAGTRWREGAELLSQAE
jgi:hypothetical protein